MRRMVFFCLCLLMLLSLACCALDGIGTKEGDTAAEQVNESNIKSKEIPEEKSEAKTEIITEKVTETATEKPTEKETEKVTEKETEKPTEKVTEQITEQVTEKATEKVTETETEKETETVTEKETEAEPVNEYILNKNTDVFHYEGCRHEKRMKEKNKKRISATYKQMINWGYNPCDTCILGY